MASSPRAVSAAPEVLLARKPEDRAAVSRSTSRTGLNDGSFYPPELTRAIDVAAATSGVAEEIMPPSMGRRHVLVVLADFPDHRGTRASDDFRELMFGSGPTLSMATYFNNVSNGRLTITGEVLDWITLPQPACSYIGADSSMGDYPQNSQKLVEDVLTHVRASVDFRSFDRDGDGMLDGLIVVHAGSGAEIEPDPEKQRRMFWSHKWNLPRAERVDGIGIWTYTLQPEDGRVGVFAHEFGHFLGLPDLYDPNYVSYGVGHWCLMGTGSWLGAGDQPSELSAWCRERLGWSHTMTASGRHTHELRTHDVLRIVPANAGANEFFLAELRHRRGLDRALPGEGVLIWHIDEDVVDNSDPSHYRVALEQSDGQLDLEFRENFGDAGDPYPGVTSNPTFGATTNPASTTYLQAPSEVTITAIEIGEDLASIDVNAPW